MIIATIEDVKATAKLLDYGVNVNAKQITDTEIQTILDGALSQVNSWIKALGLESDDDSLFYGKRLVMLETIVALCLSNYTEDKGAYITSLKAERTELKNELETNARRFVTKIVTPPIVRYKDSNLFT